MGREGQKELLAYGCFMIRECIVLANSDGRLSRSTSEEKKMAEGLGRYITAGTGKEMIRLFEGARIHIEGNVNPKIVFFDISLKLCNIFSASQRKTGKTIRVH